jgi:splicing factor 45
MLLNVFIKLILDLITMKAKQGQPTWDPDEMYDPARPNDYGEYKAWRERMKAEARVQRREMEDRKRARRRSDSEYTSESESDRGSERGGWRNRKSGTIIAL